ncbi:trypsin-7-like [Cimex lectularius]|uniref:Peptidase S1 domain-containing protein n=1 Tax=Cimex lectularius TaxID=79782 RepID=A0A8I6RWN5_CIMLE|nr:trypsin-7-like [Cimex lectularius]
MASCFPDSTENYTNLLGGQEDTKASTTNFTTAGYDQERTTTTDTNDEELNTTSELPFREDSEKGGYIAFEENRQSILEWIASLLSNLGIGGFEPTPVPPDPIDQSKCKPCPCGLTNKKIRIVGGRETEVNEYPWMALLTYENEFYCGGTLLNSKYVLTAAHCTKGFNASKIKVRLLEHDRKTDTESMTIERKVVSAIKHPGFSLTTLDNDIALLQLDQEVEIDDELMPACLPPPKKSFAGETGIVTGWGVTSASKIRWRGKSVKASTSPVLRELEVPIMSNEQCRNSEYSKSQITDNMLCAGYEKGGKDSCQGDSGGPLHVVDNDNHMVVGVVSWGEGCAKPKHPGVYCRVNRYLPWILKFTADACQCTSQSRKQK